MISVSGLSKAFGDRMLFQGVTFQLNPGERYALVGANGSGKTTLLNIMSGDVDPTGGSVSIPKNGRLGVLRQDQFLYEDEEILGVALMGRPELWHAISEKEALLAGAEDEVDADRFSELEEIVQDRTASAEVLESLADLRSNLNRQHELEYLSHRELLVARIGTEISAKLWGTAGRYAFAAKHDPQIKASLDILEDEERYRKLLGNDPAE